MIVTLFIFSAVSAEDLPGMEIFRTLFGEAGVNALHLDNFSLEGIDFDRLVRIMNSSARDYSALNFDALLDLLEEPETLSALGIGNVDRTALNAWLQDPAAEERVLAMMSTLRSGGTVNETVRDLTSDPAFQEHFRAVTGGTDFDAFAESFASGSYASFLNRAAAALMQPKTAASSETAALMASLAQKAADRLNGRR